MRTPVLAGIGVAGPWSVGTLWGLTHTPLPLFLQRITALLRSLFQQQSGCSSNLGGLAHQQHHALAALEQGAAISRGGYDGRSFDLMVAIADVLEADHGWSFEQSDAWLERMGLWEEEF